MVDKVWKRVYYDDGSLMYQVPYINGQRNGIQKHYYEDGSLQCEIRWVNNRLHGVTKWYYPDGSLDGETEFYHGIDVYIYLGSKKW